MKDVENLFKRLGTKSEYKDFGSKVLDDARQKWPLLDDVSTAEQSRTAPLPDFSAQKTLLKPAKIAAEAQEKMPVRAFVSKKSPSQESVRELFKSIGKAPRLSPSNEPAAQEKSKPLFGKAKLSSGKKE